MLIGREADAAGRSRRKPHAWRHWDAGMERGEPMASDKEAGPEIRPRAAKLP